MLKLSSQLKFKWSFVELIFIPLPGWELKILWNYRGTGV